MLGRPDGLFQGHVLMRLRSAESQRTHLILFALECSVNICDVPHDLRVHSNTNLGCYFSCGGEGFLGAGVGTSWIAGVG